MYELLLIRYGEIGTKGKNRHMFEQRLRANMEKALQGLDVAGVERAHTRFYVELNQDARDIIARLQKVFGIASMSPVKRVGLDEAHITEAAVQIMDDILARQTDQNGRKRTFKVETHRPNKSFPLTSPEVSRNLGAELLKEFPQLAVDVHTPELRLEVEIRDRFAYVYTERIPGPGGLPVGVSGKAVLLLSGGIDSPAAGHLMMKRGVEPLAVHFHSPPFTSERSREKVLDLARQLAGPGGVIPVHVVHFTEIQKALNLHCPPKLLMTVMRRFMLRIAEAIAESKGAMALITGESLGQVASQTMASLLATGHVVRLPVFRPLIGFDKLEIIELAKQIGTYDISIQPYEDCCTIFVPRHPETQPDLIDVETAEAKMPIDELIQEALERTEVVLCGKD
ncbi:MAG: tRNA 4-thiouridine(8) synthase ThiI [Firmicutes bacterium]|nr:tRNA 4-thiouridine(8) synthase ThiI [Bacillota bacterium]